MDTFNVLAERQWLYRAFFNLLHLSGPFFFGPCHGVAIKYL